MADKNYRVTIKQKGKEDTVYETETLELAQSLCTLYNNVKKKFGMTDDELNCTITKL